MVISSIVINLLHTVVGKESVSCDISEGSEENFLPCIRLVRVCFCCTCVFKEKMKFCRGNFNGEKKRREFFFHSLNNELTKKNKKNSFRARTKTFPRVVFPGKKPLMLFLKQKDNFSNVCAALEISTKEEKKQKTKKQHF